MFAGVNSEKLHLPVSIMLKHNTDSHFPTTLAPRAFWSLLRNMKVAAFRFPDLPLRTMGRSDNSLIIYVSRQGLPNETQRFLLTHVGAPGKREAIRRVAHVNTVAIHLGSVLWVDFSCQVRQHLIRAGVTLKLGSR